MFTRNLGTTRGMLSAAFSYLNAESRGFISFEGYFNNSKNNYITSKTEEFV